MHLDVDVLDDALMPAVDYRHPGGITWQEATQILGGLLASDRACGLEVTIFNPRLDPGGGSPSACPTSSPIPSRGPLVTGVRTGSGIRNRPRPGAIREDSPHNRCALHGVTVMRHRHGSYCRPTPTWPAGMAVPPHRTRQSAYRYPRRPVKRPAANSRRSDSSMRTMEKAPRPSPARPGERVISRPCIDMRTTMPSIQACARNW